jgi:hypothetical protein
VDSFSPGAAIQPASSCRECEVLRGRYRADLRVYIDAASRLETCTPAEFKRTYDDAERARSSWERSRRLMNAHAAEHSDKPD